MSDLRLLAIDTRFMPDGLLTVLDDVAGLVPPADIEVAPLVELRISSFRAGWQLPFVIASTGFRGALDWRDASTSNQGWSWGRERGTPAELLAVVASRFGLAEIS